MENNKPSQFANYTKDISVAYCKEIAETIMLQLRMPSIIKYFSWGAHNFGYCCVKNESQDQNVNAALRFKVNGMKFKGYVVVILNFLDYYDVEFVSTRKNLKHKVNDVDAFSLQEVIDEYVEKIDAYVR